MTQTLANPSFPPTRTLNPILLWGCLASCGLLLGFSAPGWNLWPLAWVSLIPALYWAQAGKPALKPVLWGGFLLGFLFQGAYCLWFFDLHPLTWLGFTPLASRLVTLAGWLLIAAEGGLIMAGLLALYTQMRQGWQRIFLFPAVWILGFALMNLTPMALPWGLLQYTQADLWPMRWLAGIIGGSGITYLLLLHNTAWAEWFLQRRDQLASATVDRKLIRFLLPGLLPLALMGLQWQTLLPAENAWPMPIGVVQANIPIEVIRSGDLPSSLIEDAYIRPVEQFNFPAGSLVVFPEEGVAPGWTPTSAPQRNPNVARLQELAWQKRIYIALGVSSTTPANQQHNSLLLLSPNPEAPPQFYHKRRLVPFGEFTPYAMEKSLSALLNSLNISYSTPFHSGDSGALLNAGKLKLGGLVCFELIDTLPLVGGYANQYQKQGAQLLINASNLGWFHNNPLIEAQFLAIGKMRAAETRLPLVIASNTGISALISVQGVVLKHTLPQSAVPAQPQIIFYSPKK